METNQFLELNLSKEVLKALEDMGFCEATQIQREAIPLIMEGRDVIGRSQTGTGKTGAFGIPAVEMVTAPEKNQVQVLVLCPTRELAMQACDEIKKFAKYKSVVKPVAVYGGAPIEKQIMSLKKGANIVIGTPGRIMDHMRRRTIKFSSLKMVILDEADEMLNMGFREDIETILSEVPEERQTILFSATMPPSIMAITKEYQTEPKLIEVAKGKQTVDAIEQYSYEVPMGRKMDTLKMLINMYEPALSIVFCNTKKMVEDLTEYLNSNGLRAAGLHGDMRQSSRSQVMTAFKAKRVPILVATDVAARGIDVENVDAVFNYDLPQDNEYYVHRIGRTGRAGKTGRAYTLISGRRQMYELRDIARMTKSNIIEQPLPSEYEMAGKKLEQFFDVIKSHAEKKDMGDTKQILDMLMSREGMDSYTAAKAILSFCCEQNRITLPREEDKPVVREKSKNGGGRAKVQISIGRRDRIAPNFIVGAIAEASNIPGKAIGKIEIYDDYTIVEMATEDAELTAETLQGKKINGKRVDVFITSGRAPRKDGKAKKDNMKPKGNSKRHTSSRAPKNKKGFAGGFKRRG